MTPLPALAADWRYTPIKRVANLCFSAVDKHKVPSEKPVRLCNYVDVYRNEQITGRLEFMDATATEAEISRLGLQLGDVLLTKDSETPGDIAVPASVREPLSGVVCGYHLALLRPRAGMLDGRFLHRALQASGIRDQFYSTAVGVTRFALGLAEVGGALVPVPPAAVQRAIADFLDRKTAAIDALIASSERMLLLLEERRLAAIAVCAQGLPGSPVRDSEVEWLGRVPAHWKTVRLSYVAAVTNGSTPSRDRPDYWDGGNIPWLSSGKVNDFIVSNASEFITEAARASSHLRVLPAGTVLVGMVGQGRTRGTSALMALSACINQNVAGVTPGPHLDSRYLHFVLTHAYWPLRELGQGGQQDALNCGTLKAFRVPLPPLAEQRALVERVEVELRRLSALVEGTEARLNLLREYRQALITAAVTGHLDIAAQPQGAA